MRDTTIARNYAEALLELARKADALRGWGAMLNDVATAMEQNETLRLFLESPRIAASEKNAVLATALQDRMPTLMVRFLQALVKNRRQMLIPAIAREYMDLVDEAEGRMHARVTVAMDPTDADRKGIAKHLSALFGKEVVPSISVDPSIMGGVVVHVGDTVLDGSVRRRLHTLSKRMLAQTV